MHICHRQNLCMVNKILQHSRDSYFIYHSLTEDKVCIRFKTAYLKFHWLRDHVHRFRRLWDKNQAL